MPQYPEQQKQAQNNNKQSLLRRLFGEPLSEKTGEKWPQLAKSWMGRQVERPDLEGAVTSVGKMGMFNKWRYPDAYAVTNPFGGIQLNRELIEKEKQDVDDILIHEMTHANQGAGGFLRKFYNPSKDEDEAVNAESLRKVRKTDIPLRPSSTNTNTNVIAPDSRAEKIADSQSSRNTELDEWNKKLRRYNESRGWK